VRAWWRHARGARLEHCEQAPARRSPCRIVDLRPHALARQDARDEDRTAFPFDRADRDALTAWRELRDFRFQGERSHADALARAGALRARMSQGWTRLLQLVQPNTA